MVFFVRVEMTHRKVNLSLICHVEENVDAVGVDAVGVDAVGVDG